MTTCDQGLAVTFDWDVLAGQLMTILQDRGAAMEVDGGATAAVLEWVIEAISTYIDRVEEAGDARPIPEDLAGWIAAALFGFTPILDDDDATGGRLLYEALNDEVRGLVRQMSEAAFSFIRLSVLIAKSAQGGVQ